MSFEVYVQSFHKGRCAGISRQRVRQAFGTHLVEKKPDFWQLRYDDKNSCDIYLTTHGKDPNAIEGFTVHRPCDDERLWDALAAILALGDIVFFFPGCQAPLVARSTVIQHLPSDMIEALGQPVVATTGLEILRAMRAT